MNEKEKITFKTITKKPENFLKVINPGQIEKTTEGILSFNTGIYGNRMDNAFPQLLIDLYFNGSPVHQSLVNLKKNLIIGNNLTALNEEDQPKLDPFLSRRNKSGDNLKTIYGRISSDFSLFNAAVLQIIFNREGDIADVYAVPVQDFRLGENNKYGQIEYGYISKNWARITNEYQPYNRKEFVKIRMFDPTLWKKFPTQLMYIRDYGYNYYAMPSYTSVINWIIIDRAISDFHKNNIKSSFLLNMMITQVKGGMTEEQMDEKVREMENFYSGESAKKILFAFIDNIADKPVIDVISGHEQDKLFEILSKQTAQNIVTGHNAQPALAGLSEIGADLGGDANKLYTSIKVFMEFVTNPMQRILVDAINRILEYNRLPLVTVITEPPKLTPPIASPDDLTREERRAILYGLPPDDNKIESPEIPS
jgi:hypothetical protein